MEKSYELGLEALAAELDEWRSVQDRRRRIPEPFWSRAAELADELGVTRVSTTLRLSFEGLKRRALSPAAPTVAEGPAFLEWLIAPQTASCLFKVESASGARMQVEVASLPPSGLVAEISKPAKQALFMWYARLTLRHFHPRTACHHGVTPQRIPGRAGLASVRRPDRLRAPDHNWSRALFHGRDAATATATQKGRSPTRAPAPKGEAVTAPVHPEAAPC